METEVIHNQHYTLIDNRMVNPQLFTLNLPYLIGNMRQSNTWTSGDLKSMILLNNPDKQILLTALHERTEIISFQANDSVTIQILEGELMFRSGKESLTLKKGQSLTLHEKVNYSLITIIETVFLMTISRGIRMKEN
jgi:hypothetical protein